ncbi:MAG: DNA-binding protein [Deinococcus sp.]|nr:DNA-binding protein [Deinococcus sp.]
MTSITVPLPDQRLLELQKTAARLGVAPEDLVRASIEELLTRPDEAFMQAMELVVKKNAKLYKRLG